jgi:23S rRNA (uridine2552-2'-O)-methyltransferase
MARSRSGRGAKNTYKGGDSFTREARLQGFPARSVFKLEEIDRRVHLLKQGQRVLDLGASPGSWSLYVTQKIGAQGRLVAIDLEPIAVPLPPNATAIVGDALALDNEALAEHAPYDVVLSDMAPRTTGNRIGDQTRSFELYMRALAVAEALLKPGGTFVGKIFMGEDLPQAKAATRRLFTEERGIRPEGTRATSYEMFIIGLNKKVLVPSQAPSE